MAEHVDLDAQQVSNGAAQWEAASSAVNSGWQNAMARVSTLCCANPWGSDAAGSTFAGNFKPLETLEAPGKEVIGQVVELGPKVTTAVGLSLAADEQQAAEMKSAGEGL